MVMKKSIHIKNLHIVKTKKDFSPYKCNLKKGYTTFFLKKKKKLNIFQTFTTFFPYEKDSEQRKKYLQNLTVKWKIKKHLRFDLSTFKKVKFYENRCHLRVLFFIVYSNFRPNCVSNRNNKFILSLRVFHNGVEYVIILIKISHLWTRL